MLRAVIVLCVLAVSLTNSLPNTNRGETGDLTPPNLNPYKAIRFENGIPADVILAASTNSRGDPLNLDPRAAGNRFDPKRLLYMWPKHAQPARFPQSVVPEARGADIKQAQAGCCKTDSYQR